MLAVLDYYQANDVAGMLASKGSAIRNMVLDAVADEIPKYKATDNGLQKSTSSLP